MAIGKTLVAIGLGAAALLSVSAINSGTSNAEAKARPTSPSAAIAPVTPIVPMAQDIRTSPDLSQFGAMLQPSPDPRWGGWVEEKPYITEGKTYSDEEIQKAVKIGVDYILDQQDADGSWDVVLTGLLGQTADDAVDTIIATSLSGLALRAHAGVDQQRIEKALAKARIFVADRIIRGKLPTQVQYACWRYAYGLRFLATEFKYIPESDTESIERVQIAVERMRDSVINMQLISHDKQFSEGDPMPATLGIRVSPPTMTDYLGGAPIESIVPGTKAEMVTAGSLGKLQAGDRIFKIGRSRVENAYDFYSSEAEMIEGKTYDVFIRRDGVTALAKIYASKTWPADVGVTVKDDPEGEGAEITGFRRGSEAQANGALVGDIIYKLGNKIVKSAAEFVTAEGELRMWKKNETMRVKRGKKNETIKFFVRPRPSVNLGFLPNDEDKNAESGVGVLALPRDRRTGQPVSTPATIAGLKVQDFITSINGIKILGYDHYLDVVGRIPGYSTVDLTVLRDGEEAKVSYAAGGNPFPGWFGLRLNDDLETANPEGRALIGEVAKYTVGYKAGLKAGDEIVAITLQGNKYILNETPWAKQNYSNLAIGNYLLGQFVAGDTAEIEYLRGTSGKTQTVSLTAEIAPADDVLAEGGWAYYPKGLAPSFTTAAMLIFFDEVEGVFGRDMRLPRKSQKAAVQAILGMRKEDKRNKEYGYVYDQRDIEKELASAPETVKERARGNWMDVRGHMGRIMACELSLALNGKRSKSALRHSLQTWLKFRDELDIVRNFPHTHYQARYNNAAYYWLFGHYFALRAANYIGSGKEADTTRALVLSVVMQDREPDGTWLGHRSFGKLCGTSLALMIFGEYDDTWRMPSGKGGKVITPGGTQG